MQDAHRFADKNSLTEALGARLDPPSYALGGWGAYGLSKAANVLFTVELQRRFDEVHCPCALPMSTAHMH